MTFVPSTTGRPGSLHPRLNQEACRPVSRSHRPFTLPQCLLNRLVQPIVMGHPCFRLKPHGISGELTTPSETRACNMYSTGTGSDAVIAHSDTHSRPCAVLTPEDDFPHPTKQGHFPTGTETSSAPTASISLETSANPQLSRHDYGPIPLFCSLRPLVNSSQQPTSHPAKKIQRHIVTPP